MSADKDWFQGRRVEMTDLDRDERERLRPIVGRVLVLLGVFAASAFIALQLTGCANEEQVWQRVCYEQPLGRAENGMVVVRHFCVREGEQ